MGKLFAIATVFLLLNFVAFSQIPSDKNLRIGINNLSGANFSGTISNTEPDISYEIQRKQGQTNWISVGLILGSGTTNWTPFNFKISGDINPKTVFRVRSWIDSQGVGIPDWWQLQYFGDVGVDPYGNAAGDGWNNLQKFQNGMNPFTWYEPPKPVYDVTFYGDGNNSRKGRAVLTWKCLYGTIPDYFLIERANRTLRPMTNDSRFMRPGSYGINGKSVTNRPPDFRPMYGRPGSRREDPLITGPFELVTRISGQPGVRDYRYVETNVDTLFQPIYRIQAHYSPPLHAYLDQVNAAAIRKTILPVTAPPPTNGYALTVTHPIPYARYLLLVRDKNDPQWRASGYFASGTNRNPVYLHVDKKGMMSDGQSPIAMPEVKYLPDVVAPEFTAGWGEDSDGDGLPDIYEVLVTHTAPDNADTGDTGILDGYKEMTGDGWGNLEKFRRRVNPLHPAHPPATVELIRPTGSEIMNAVTPKTDLSCELQIEVRTNGATSYQPIDKLPWALSRIMNFRQPKEHKNCDLRISWQFAEPKANQYGSNPFERGQASFQAIASLAQKINIQLVETFKATLATNPPLSRTDMTNNMAAIEHACRQGEIDRSVAMGELMALQDNQSQNFYGKAVDQNGQPVAGADVSVEVNLTIGHGGTQNNKTDAAGLFQFTGLRGQSLNLTLEKKGFQISSRGPGLKGLNGSDTSPNNRAVYSMWKKGQGTELISSENGMRP
ncbi:MAG: carboxypeptidase-like regulatory domain-containing protein, partial [Verrucomicrobia bacterium]|nr:carboxypeptidase-like regulatory domain-containing protein [Verrucomicrobiota bacterium]